VNSRVRVPAFDAVRVAWRSRAATVVGAIVVGLAAFVSAAQAHAQIASGTVYDSGKLCVRNITIQGHNYNSVEVGSATDSVFYLPPMSCGYKFARPQGYLAARWESYKWSYVKNAWIMCGTQGYEYGGGDRFVLGRHTTGCGPAWYAMAGLTYVYNGGWFGGALVTDYEWLHD
jgi:hypothetical protein